MTPSEPIDYRTAMGALQEMEQEIKALCGRNHEVSSHGERGALADRARAVATLLGLYADLLTLLPASCFGGKPTPYEQPWCPICGAQVGQPHERGCVNT